MSSLKDAVIALDIMGADTGHSYMRTHNGRLAVSFVKSSAVTKTVRDCATGDLSGL